MKKSRLIFTVFTVFAFLVANAQDSGTDSHDITISVPAVALVDIEPSANNSITMAFVAPTEAGLPLTNPTDNTALWLNYSSIIDGDNPDRTISVQVDAVYLGADILVEAAVYAGNGEGTMGTPSAQLTLTGIAQNIITGIGSAYTGDGANNGHNLTYSLVASGAGTANYADLEADAGTDVTVTYTISDN